MKISLKILENETWLQGPFSVGHAWIDHRCLQMADRKLSIRALADRWGVSAARVQRYLAEFELIESTVSKSVSKSVSKKSVSINNDKELSVSETVSKSVSGPKFNGLSVFCDVWRAYYHKGYVVLGPDMGAARQINRLFVKGRDEERFKQICERYFKHPDKYAEDNQHPFSLMIRGFNRFNIPLAAFERKKSEHRIEDMPPEFADIDVDPGTLPFEEIENV